MLDFLLAFFVCAYHLRDWLARAHPELKNALDALFSKSTPLRLCADIANVAKHLDLTSPPREDVQFSLAREYAGEGQGWFGGDARLLFLTPSHREDLLRLAEECLHEWSRFLIAGGLLQVRVGGE